MTKISTAAMTNKMFKSGEQSQQSTTATASVRKRKQTPSKKVATGLGCATNNQSPPTISPFSGALGASTAPSALSIMTTGLDGASTAAAMLTPQTMAAATAAAAAAAAASLPSVNGSSGGSGGGNGQGGPQLTQAAFAAATAALATAAAAAGMPVNQLITQVSSSNRKRVQLFLSFNWYHSKQLMAQANQQQMLLQQVQADLIQQTKVNPQ